ncbi:MAG: queuosine 5'-phosphate N-glycosylase/hydrolase [Planctomycetota bacterium]|jgi:hypothetical protein
MADSGTGEQSVLNRVRPETARVVERAVHVRVDRDAASRFAERSGDAASRAPEWDREKQWTDATDRTAEWVFVLDTLNFCFWPDAGKKRWTVRWGEETHRGYYALSCALKRAQLGGVPIADPAFYANMDERTLADVLRGEGEPPLLAERAALLRENGRVLLEKWDGRFAELLRASSSSAARLVDLVVRDFPGFRDVQAHEGEPVHFLKRAQILVSDLWGAFGGKGPGGFRDLEALTAFADYRIPQILRSLSILHYDHDLAEKVDGGTVLVSGCREEVEIRASTVQGVEAVADALAAGGKRPASFEIDWWLWNESHKPEHNVKPYHRTRTVWY